ncbi:pyruvate dehydrogenase complex dihydrolipoyllysine-residue acetyltransferase [Pseudomonas sp. Choline-3u-10]|uniref:dihydrolipoyllysine-residue acetyltransferase n=1 Tax=Pseudomonadaceae TaxID=135621 RepID=UPI000C333781|nr:dihydrolipoyllysine-residue acetyltransferase [Pseudomonas sp. Choline-3u-10]MAL37386.1 pyruvate dehydrogenase complex dihydrolipoyllysine-residue acetyltransferase [Pseudomonas sp.]MBK3793742.1 dihydrolipoyllysine-residue acetyltransferase [Stutzerimonas stutzeri]MBU0949505.1 dihydrolipoyllysine-residue acetyltransferase [Gammaproteobacteria bacterium]MBK3875232.1 dihydrolipoyllysine-residue acetyltransferase [Stutzerimonas stutzeri]PKG94834.1 pyruvate dehydrogenase complex dihydrolipoylly
MSETIRVPDIGSGEGEVIELFVKVGDRIEADQSILTLESDKASMEIPAPKAGVVKSLKVKLGDTLKEGDELLELESEEGQESEAPAEAAAEPAGAATGGPADETEAPTPVGDDAPSASAEEGESQEIKVPDIGSDGKASVIGISVKVGDTIAAEQALITLESDKASMEIPSPAAGVVESISVKVGDEVGTGDLILILKGAASSKPAAASASDSQAQSPAKEKLTEQATEAPAEAAGESVEEVRIPDIGSSGSAKVIEVMIKAGDSVEADQSLITLESDKASMEIPAPKAGVVESLSIKVGDDAKTGDLILTLKVAGAAPAKKAEPKPQQEAAPQQQAVAPNKQGVPEAKAASTPAPAVSGPSKAGTKVHAGPAVRMTAREFGVELADVTGTGPKGRILKEDVQAYVKNMLHKTKQASAEGATGGAGIPPIPTIDFSRFGEIEEVPMSRLMQVGAANLHRSWLNVPHVTQFESADITELEAFRVAQKAIAEKAGVKLTVLPLLLKACAHLLKELPEFNASLSPSGKSVIRKKYVHVGFAVDTPDGLMVPVIRNVDQKSLLQLAAEAAELAEKARTKKLSPDAMQGACFTISSLGHIGGTGFTPIVNAPEVAILGVSKAAMQPVWDGKAFQPRLMLPLSLSYDHRVINGAAAARFTKRLSELLADIRTMLL